MANRLIWLPVQWIDHFYSESQRTAHEQGTTKDSLDLVQAKRLTAWPGSLSNGCSRAAIAHISFMKSKRRVSLRSVLWINYTGSPSAAIAHTPMMRHSGSTRSKDDYKGPGLGLSQEADRLAWLFVLWSDHTSYCVPLSNDSHRAAHDQRAALRSLD